MRTDPLPVLLCFDAEPDDRHVEGRPEEWPGVGATAALLNRWRPRLAEASGRPAAFSWFLRLDPQIAELYGTALWPVSRYGKTLDSLRGAGDEVGLHVHTWRREPGGGPRWVCDFSDREWTDRCIESAFAAYEQAFGRRCQSFRFGERWMSDEAMTSIERCGARFDLSLEPGHFDFASFDLKGEHFRGPFPDCRGVPDRPYRPSRRNFTRSGTWGSRRRLWEVPVTTAPTSMRTEPDSTVQTLFLSAPPALFAEVVAHRLATRRTRHLAIVARTDVGRRPDQAAPSEENLAHLAALARRRPLAFVTPEPAVRLAAARPLGG